MSMVSWTEADTQRAKKLWSDYASTHDLSDRLGQAAGIDPNTGEVWFGESMADIVRKLEATGAFRPLFFVRVGHETYQRKGGHR